MAFHLMSHGNALVAHFCSNFHSEMMEKQGNNQVKKVVMFAKMRIHG